MPSIKLYLFGAPRIEREHITVHVDTRKAIALLAYLSCQPGFQSRDTLAAALWPESDSQSARAALRRTLSTLNHALDGAGLRIKRDAIALAAGPDLCIDVVEFQQRLQDCRSHGHPASETCDLCVRPLTEAVELASGGFMQGFSLRDSAEFDLWQSQQMEHFNRLLASSLERLTALYIAHSDYATAIQYAKRWLALDPLHEPAHCHLMRLYTWSGQRSLALLQYRECVRVLEQELSVAPLEETSQVHRLIMENRLESPPVQPISAITPAEVTVQASVASEILQQLPLVGRDTEMRQLRERYALLTKDARPTGALVVVEGEAGIGKTRLVGTFATEVSSRGRVLSAACYDSENGLVYTPFIRMLRGALNAAPQDWPTTVPVHWLSELIPLLPELSASFPGLARSAASESAGAQSRLFEAIHQALCAILAGPLPGLLVLDDTQWIDSASLDLLAYLVRRWREQRLMLALCWRDQDVSRTHRLRLLIAEAQRAGSSVCQIQLQRLDATAVAKLARSADLTGIGAPRQFAERLFKESEGLPFFVVEYLALLHKHTQPLDETTWDMPEGVQDLLHSRVAGLNETSQQVLSAAAVIERSFDPDLLRDVSGRSEDEVVDALDDLLRYGLVHEMGDAPVRTPVYDFYHDKLRVLIYDETSQARRRLLHRRAAQAILNRTGHTPQRDGVAGQVAHHLRAGGQDQEAARYFQIAGAHARRLYANREALTCFESALALGCPDTAQLHESIGDLRTLLGEYALALSSYEAALALYPAGHASHLERRLGNVYQREGEWDLAENCYQMAYQSILAGLEAGSSARSGVLADWSLTCFQRGDTVRAELLANQALDIASATSDNRALAQTHNLLGILARNRGDLDVTRVHAEESSRIADLLGEPGMRIAALNNLALLLSAAGEYERARDLLETAIAECRRQGDLHHEAALLNNQADVFHALQQPDQAMARLKQAVMLFSQIGLDAGAMRPEIWKLTEW